MEPFKLYIVGRERRRRDVKPATERRGSANAMAQRFVGVRGRTVSRRHAEVYIVGNRIYVRDLGSKNGTFVVRDGDKIRLDEGYVEPGQTMYFGQIAYPVDELMAATGVPDAEASPQTPSRTTPAGTG